MIWLDNWEFVWIKKKNTDVTLPQHLYLSAERLHKDYISSSSLLEKKIDKRTDR